MVGRSHECDYPESILGLPVCTEAKLPAGKNSSEIDRSVKAIVREGLSVYRVDADLLRELQPDVILTQTQCEVCAVSLKDVEQALCEWVGPGRRPRIVSLEPDDLAGVWRDIRRVAEALGEPERGVRLVNRLRSRMEEIAGQAAKLDRPRLATIEWIDPLMAAGNWMPELIDKAGGRNLFGEAGRHSPPMSWEELRGADPEVMLLCPCGFDMDRTVQDLPLLKKQSGWSEVSAVRDGRVFVADGNAFFNRPGPRLVESLEILAEILHPDRFDFGHEGTGWRRVS